MVMALTASAAFGKDWSYISKLPLLERGNVLANMTREESADYNAWREEQMTVAELNKKDLDDLRFAANRHASGDKNYRYFNDKSLEEVVAELKSPRKSPLTKIQQALKEADEARAKAEAAHKKFEEIRGGK